MAGGAERSTEWAARATVHGIVHGIMRDAGTVRCLGRAVFERCDAGTVQYPDCAASGPYDIRVLRC